MIRLVMLDEFPVIFLELLCDTFAKGHTDFHWENLKLFFVLHVLERENLPVPWIKRTWFHLSGKSMPSSPIKKFIHAQQLEENAESSHPLHQADISISARPCRKDKSVF